MELSCPWIAIPPPRVVQIHKRSMEGIEAFGIVWAPCAAFARWGKKKRKFSFVCSLFCQFMDHIEQRRAGFEFPWQFEIEMEQINKAWERKMVSGIDAQIMPRKEIQGLLAGFFVWIKNEKSICPSLEESLCQPRWEVFVWRLYFNGTR